MADYVATIAAGESLSDAVNVVGAITGLAIPANWHQAAMTFQSSSDGTTWFNLHDIEAREILINVMAGSYISIPPTSDLSNKAQIKIRSGSRDHPIVQPEQVTVTIVSA